MFKLVPCPGRESIANVPPKMRIRSWMPLIPWPTSGELFCSVDRGEHWSRLPGQLSRILTVKSWVMET